MSTDELKTQPLINFFSSSKEETTFDYYLAKLAEISVGQIEHNQKMDMIINQQQTLFDQIIEKFNQLQKQVIFLEKCNQLEKIESGTKYSVAIIQSHEKLDQLKNQVLTQEQSNKQKVQRTTEIKIESLVDMMQQEQQFWAISRYDERFYFDTKHDLLWTASEEPQNLNDHQVSLKKIPDSLLTKYPYHAAYLKLPKRIDLTHFKSTGSNFPFSKPINAVDEEGINFALNPKNIDSLALLSLLVYHIIAIVDLQDKLPTTFHAQPISETAKYLIYFKTHNYQLHSPLDSAFLRQFELFDIAGA